MSPRDVAHLLMDRFKFGDTRCPGASRAHPKLHSIACNDITQLLEGWLAEARAKDAQNGGAS